MRLAFERRDIVKTLGSIGWQTCVGDLVGAGKVYRPAVSRDEPVWNDEIRRA